MAPRLRSRAGRLALGEGPGLGGQQWHELCSVSGLVWVACVQGPGGEDVGPAAGSGALPGTGGGHGASPLQVAGPGEGRPAPSHGLLAWPRRAASQTPRPPPHTHTRHQRALSQPASQTETEAKEGPDPGSLGTRRGVWNSLEPKHSTNTDTREGGTGLFPPPRTGGRAVPGTSSQGAGYKPGAQGVGLLAWGPAASPCPGLGPLQSWLGPGTEDQGSWVMGHRVSVYEAAGVGIGRRDEVLTVEYQTLEGRTGRQLLGLRAWGVGSGEPGAGRAVGGRPGLGSRCQASGPGCQALARWGVGALLRGGWSSAPVAWPGAECPLRAWKSRRPCGSSCVAAARRSARPQPPRPGLRR